MSRKSYSRRWVWAAAGCLMLGILPYHAWSFALAATGTIDLKGKDIVVDSFDSADPLYSTAGRYDPAKNKDNGDVITSGSGTTVLNIGNAKIMGRVGTGPGTNTISIGPGGSVGDKAWVEGGNKGIEPGWASTNVTNQWPDMVLPRLFWFSVAPGSYDIDGTNYQYAFLADGDYVLSAVSGSIFVGTNTFVRLKIDGDVLLGAGEVVRLGGTNSHLRIYMMGASFNANGNIESASGRAQDFIFYGLPGNTSISLAGSFTGTIYAPAADLTLAGGGATNHFVGVSITKTVTASGRLGIHFDENLMALPPAIAQQPQDQSVVAGQNATFTVSMRSHGPFAYQWRFNGAPLPTATNSSLTISNACSANAGFYSVVVTNAYGSTTSSNATLTVNYADWLWARSASSPQGLPGANGSVALGLATDPAQNVFVAGTFDDPTLDLGGLVLTNDGPMTAFICKFDAGGGLLWAKAACTNSSGPRPFRVAADPYGNAYLAGHFAGTAKLGTNSFVSVSPADMFLAKYDSEGRVVWARQIGAYESTYWNSFGLAADPQGNVSLCSRYDGAATFGNLVISNSPAFVAKYNAAGNLVFARPAVAADAIAAGTDGALYLAGAPGTLSRYDQAGTLVWLKPFPIGLALALDGADNIYATGYGGEGTYDGLGMTNIGGMPDGFVAKCNAGGQMLWLRQFGSTTQQRGVALTLDPAGGLYVAGLSATLNADPALSFGAITLTNVLAFMAEYDRWGTALWAGALATTNRCFPRALAAADPAAVYLGGSFRGSARFGGFTLIDTNSAFPHGSLFVAKFAGLISPVPILQLAAPSAAGEIRFNVLGGAGFRYAVEASSDFRNWTPLLTNTSPFLYSETGITNHPQKFYRAVYR